MELNKLKLTNFKGIRSFEIVLDGDSCNIYGDNATGKTSLFDAFLWLLFDKDSQGKKDFAIKTLNADGQELNNIEHSVEAALNLNGQVLQLQKIYKEKWTKKRGQATESFTGHTTDYFIDGVPVSKKEYDEKVNCLIDEKVFKLLTSPAFFNEQLSWQERRTTLLEMVGDITDEDVINSNQQLKPLIDVIKNRSIDNQKKVINVEKIKINQELKEIPIRISELKPFLIDISHLNKNTVEKDIKYFEEKYNEILQKINDTKNGIEATEIKSQIKALELNQLEIEQKYKKLKQQEDFNYKEKLIETINVINEYQYYSNRKKETIDEFAAINRKKEEMCNELRAQWQEIYMSKFSYPNEMICPACGQDLPEDEKEKRIVIAQEAFNVAKAKDLEKITNEGILQKKFIEKNLSLITGLEKQIENTTLKLQELNEKKKELQKLIDEDGSKEQEDFSYKQDSTYKYNQKQLTDLKEKLIQLQTNENIVVEELNKKLEDINSHLSVSKLDFLKIEEQVIKQARIAELQAKEKELVKAYEELEQQLFLIEEFIRTKVSLLTESINKQFKLAKFKLFDEQINGGLAECCETTFEGVPYSTGLNNAAKINVGLDIINTLSKHYNTTAPIWIDNRESVTKLLSTEAQVINLFVNQADKTLRVEILNKMRSAV